MGEAVYRASPGCERACAQCDVRCAILAGEADDAWREVERQRREYSHHPSQARWESLQLAQARLAVAERDSAQARPDARGARLFLAWSQTFVPERAGSASLQEA